MTDSNAQPPPVVDFLTVTRPDGSQHVRLDRTTDGRVMCQLCFTHFHVEDLNINDDGHREDVCTPCAIQEKQALLLRYSVDVVDCIAREAIRLPVLGQPERVHTAGAVRCPVCCKDPDYVTISRRIVTNSGCGHQVNLESTPACRTCGYPLNLGYLTPDGVWMRRCLNYGCDDTWEDPPTQAPTHPGA